MKILKDLPVLDIKGEALYTRAGKPMLIEDVVLEVILSDTEEDKKSQDMASNKAVRYELSKRFLESDLTEQEVRQVTERAALLCSSLIYGRFLESIQTDRAL